MVHTRFFSSESDANTEYERMKTALEELLSARPADNRTEPFHDSILAFVQAFP
jgi:hypothetical protein